MRKFFFTCRPNARTILQVLEGFNTKMLAEMFKSWNDGTRGYATFHRVGKKKSPEELGYYYAVILPMAFQAMKDKQKEEDGGISIDVTMCGKRLELPLTEKVADTIMKWRYGKWRGDYQDKGDMNMAQCAAFMDFCIKWLAKFYNCHVPPADPNWSQK